MKVPLLDLRAQHESQRDELFKAMQRVGEAQQFIMGPEVRAFEEEIAGYIKTRHAVGCASASHALLLALMDESLLSDTSSPARVLRVSGIQGRGVETLFGSPAKSAPL